MGDRSTTSPEVTAHPRENSSANSMDGLAVKAEAVAGTSPVGLGCSCCADVKGLKEALVETPLNILLLTVPVAIAGTNLEWGDEAVFALNFLAILPLAGLLGHATEQLALHVGEMIGGLLNATFGNAVEMLLSVFALRAGLVDVVQGSLLGSVLSNLLLVLGMCFFFGGMKIHTLKFNADGARTQANLLLLATLALAIPTMAFIGEGMDPSDVSPSALFTSRGCAIVLAVVYTLYLFFQLFTHPGAFAAIAGEEGETEEASMSATCAALLLAVMTVLVAICSEGLVGSVEGLTEKLGISRLFIGVILLPIVGNAAEHLTAVSVAMKNKLDLSLGVALGSSTQIALFVVPFTVLAGWCMDVPMNLVFRPMGTGTMLITVLIVGGLTGDGESNWMEGAMLISAYICIAVSYWVLD